MELQRGHSFHLLPGYGLSLTPPPRQSLPYEMDIGTFLRMLGL